jgi:hypothetical protein
LLARAVYQGTHAPQVGIPAAPPRIIRVTDYVSVLRAFAANLTFLGHKGYSKRYPFSDAAF